MCMKKKFDHKVKARNKNIHEDTFVFNSRRK